LGFLTAVNATLGGLADVADIGAVAFSDIAASLALTGQTAATALHRQGQYRQWHRRVGRFRSRYRRAQGKSARRERM
jgi:hypothetical protein